MFISHLSACFGLGAGSFGKDCLIIVIKMGTSYTRGAQGNVDGRKFTSLPMQIIRPYPHPPSGGHFISAITTSWPPKVLILINACQRKEDISDIYFPIRLLFSSRKWQPPSFLLWLSVSLQHRSSLCQTEVA